MMSVKYLHIFLKIITLLQISFINLCFSQQFALDMQFLVGIARRGGYLTTNMNHSSTDLVLQMESAMVSAGFDLNRYINFTK